MYSIRPNMGLVGLYLVNSLSLKTIFYMSSQHSCVNPMHNILISKLDKIR